MASLVLSTRLAVHKQSFLNLLLRQNGCHLTKVYRGILWLWKGGEGEGRGARGLHQTLDSLASSVCDRTVNYLIS